MGEGGGWLVVFFTAQAAVVLKTAKVTVLYSISPSLKELNCKVPSVAAAFHQPVFSQLCNCDKSTEPPPQAGLLCTR